MNEEKEDQKSIKGFLKDLFIENRLEIEEEWVWVKYIQWFKEKRKKKNE